MTEPTREYTTAENDGIALSGDQKKGFIALQQDANKIFAPPVSNLKHLSKDIFEQMKDLDTKFNLLDATEGKKMRELEGPSTRSLPTLGTRTSES